jgi:HEAT repeat protein
MTLRSAALLAAVLFVAPAAFATLAPSPQGSSWPPLPPPGGGGGSGTGVGGGPGAGSGGGPGAGGIGGGGGATGGSGADKLYGPGGTSPPPNGGGSPPSGGGGYTPPSPAAPSAPVPATSPGTAPPISPASPGAQPGPPVAGLAPAAISVSGPGTLSGADLTNWSFWWYFNREGLLDLRRRFTESGPTTGEALLAGHPTDIPTRPSDRALLSTVLPALFDSTADGQQATLRLSAAIALARIGEPEGEHVIATLSELLRERNPTLREGAALALGIDGDATVVAELITVMIGGFPAKKVLGYKPNDRVRAFAAYGLGLAAERAPNDDMRRVILRPLLEQFRNHKEPTDLRVAALSALSLLDIECGPALEEPMGKKRGKPVVPRYRRDLIRELWNIYEDEKDRTVRGHLPVVLGRLLAGTPDDVRDEGIARLLAALDEDPRNLELYGIITALGIVGQAWGHASDETLRATLYAQATKQRESHARHLAMMSLSEVVSNSGAVLPPTEAQHEFEAFLLTSFDDGRRADRPWIAMAAGSFGARLRAPSKLLAQTEGARGKHRNGRVGADLVGRLREIVRASGSPDELSAAVLALGLIEDASSANDVEALLGSTSNKNVRGYAALSLGLMHKKSAMLKLEILLDDLRYDPAALEHAAMGLALLDRARGSAILRERLSDAHSSTTTAPLAAAIGRVSDRGSVLSLSRLATDDDMSWSVREFASIALGLICDRSDLTWRSHLAEDVNYAAWTPTLFDSAGQGVLNIF